MLLHVRLCEKHVVSTVSKILHFSTASNMTNKDADNKIEEEEFRVLQVKPPPPEPLKQKQPDIPAAPPRTIQMRTDQDWPSIWPGARTFHPAVVPLPLRQGFSLPNQPPPAKYANAELLKIPNFLHLTPPAIRRHCEAIKQFCTQWPAGLEADEDCTKHFPVEIISSDYCYASPTIREPLARIVNLRVKLSSLNLDTHAKDKILRLLGDKYNPDTDFITITADRCPTKKQNLDYVKYLLTAVYHESWRHEPWEAEKSEADMEYYDWDRSVSRKSLVTLHKWPEVPIDFDYEDIPHVVEYKIAVSDLQNNGEDLYSVNKYKEAVKSLLNLSYNENA